MDKTPEDLIVETYNKVNQIWTAFFGVPNTNDKGMCGEFQSLKSDYYSFKRKVLVVFAFVLGTGSLGLGILKLAEWLG